MSARRYQDVEDTLRKNGPAWASRRQSCRCWARWSAYEPSQRFQNPTELVEAIQACRVEMRHAET